MRKSFSYDQPNSLGLQLVTEMSSFTHIPNLPGSDFSVHRFQYGSTRGWKVDETIQFIGMMQTWLLSDDQINALIDTHK